jgi:SAM-dependent methyltransferase
VNATPAPHERAHYWDDRYDEIGDEHVSWFQRRPIMSLELIDAAGADPSTAVIDVGGGSSRLVDELIARGFADITVLDVSRTALELARRRVDDRPGVTWLQTDLLTWTPERQWGLWHDRAVFHFLTQTLDRAIYLGHLARALTPGGAFIIATFGPSGPTTAPDSPSAATTRHHSPTPSARPSPPPRSRCRATRPTRPRQARHSRSPGSSAPSRVDDPQGTPPSALG